MPGLTTAVGGLVTANPVWVGSSELTMTLEGITACIDAGAGAVVAKSVNESAAGRRQLDIADYAFVDERFRRRAGASAGRADGLLNRSGLAQPDLDEWLTLLADGADYGTRRGCPVVGSITLGDPDAAAEIAAAMGDVVPAVELNVGAPHAHEASAVRRLTQEAAVRQAVSLVRCATGVPLFVKLPGQAADVTQLAAAARDAGADAVGLVGRYPGFLPDLERGGAILGSRGAWGSPGCLPMSLYWVSRCRAAFGPDLSIVGTNGARDAEDVARFLASGADAVEVASALWIDGVDVIGELVDGVTRLLAARRAHLRAFVGSALRGVQDYADIEATRKSAWLPYTTERSRSSGR